MKAISHLFWIWKFLNNPGLRKTYFKPSKFSDNQGSQIFHWSAGLSVQRDLHDRTNLHWSRAWQISLISITAIVSVGTNFSEILIKMPKLSYNKMHLEMTSAQHQPFSVGLNVLNNGLLTMANFLFMGPYWSLLTIYHVICIHFYIFGLLNYVLVMEKLAQLIYPLSSGLLHWHWTNHRKKRSSIW